VYPRRDARIVGAVRRVILIATVVAALVASDAAAALAIPSGRYAIGDSVMLGAKPQLTARGFVVNVKKSRQFSEAVGIVKQKKRNGLLRRKVIIHLGTNGVLIQASDCDTISRVAGRHRRVFLVTVTGPTKYPKIRKAQNIRLHACADRHRNTKLIDWYAYSRGHGAWFYDGMHLTPKGRLAYARLLDRRTS
jgi:hypothetical protein